MKLLNTFPNPLNKIKRIGRVSWLMLKSVGRTQYKFYVYFGVPGSGKTTYAAWLTRRFSKRGGTVYSNVPIKGALQLDPVADIGKVLVSNGHIIIDEAGVEYNNRDFKTFPKEATYFFKHHRHYKTTVHLFSQGYNDMDKKLRTLATSLYVIKKSMIPFCIRKYEISKRIGINDMTKDICDEYFKRPFSSRLVFTPTLWDMFDTYSTRELPDKEWSKWD